MNVVISDTSPISGLIRLNLLELLPKLYGELIIPPTVYAELLNLSVFGYEMTPLTTASWLKIVPPQNYTLLSQLSQDLDLGEAEVIVLAKEQRATLLIIDEKKGRAIAREMDLPIVGLLGVLIEAKKKKHIPLIKPLLIELQKLGFRISPSLFELVLKEAKE